MKNMLWFNQFFLALCMLLMNTAFAVEVPRTEDERTIYVPAFDLPESSFLSEEARAALRRNAVGKSMTAGFKTCPSFEGASKADMVSIRQCLADSFYNSSFYKEVRQQYKVNVDSVNVNGVYTEIFTPERGVKDKNKHRILINLHGGAFKYGSRTTSQLESIPIAALGKIKVISIDYRMAPEYTYPSATEDVVSVYKEILNEYEPEDIGIYGCSAGAVLTGQSISWFQKEGLPLPGAIGLFCGATHVWHGDSDHMTTPLYNVSPGWVDKLDYYKDMDPTDPLAYPGISDGIMSKFPPTLLITSTRDMGLSPVVVTHSQLVRLGVKSDLHVWEGMRHAFHLNPEFPESREAYDVIVTFFDKHLGK